jgi:lipoprotein-releasing system permease protein
VAEAYPVVESYSVAQGPTQLGLAVVRGMTAADVRATTLVSDNIVQGSLQGYGQGEYGGELILIGSGLATTLGVRAGDPLTLLSPSGESTAFGSTPRSKTYTVGRRVRDRAQRLRRLLRLHAAGAGPALLRPRSLVDSLEIKVDDPDQIARYLPAIRQAAGPGAVVSDWRDANAAFFNTLQVERNVMRLILMLLVAIAFMNIISGLVMLVKNKGRDVAVLRTLGASQGSILRVFFMSGAMIGIVGTILGLMLGVIFCTFIEQIQAAVEFVTGTVVFDPETYFLSRLPARIEWLEVLWITLFAFAMSCLATLPPAIRASKIDPGGGAAL